MYAVSKEHKGTKLFAKTRRVSSKLDNNCLENSNRDSNTKRDLNHLSINEISVTAKPVFHMNGRDRRSYHHRTHHQTITAQHEEIIKYIHDSWKSVKRELDSGPKFPSINSDSKINKVPHIAYYKLDKGNLSHLSNFEPFDLETFWGQRLFQNITQST